jgi:hypothetical protein
MKEHELRSWADHYRRVALLVSDDATTGAMLELAAEYETLAQKLADERRIQRAADNTQPYPPRQIGAEGDFPSRQNM